MRLRSKIALALVSALGTAAIAAALTASPALAVPNTGNNWCIGNSNDCMNAWNGGPWVKQYTGGPGVANGDFTWDHGSALPAQYLVFTNYGSAWSNQCIGDANNDPNDARASMNACPGATTGTGTDNWGTHITAYSSPCSNGYLAFKDNHWNNWIGPANLTDNGAQYYLHKPVPFCFRAYPVA